jgi:hypothetical protein
MPVDVFLNQLMSVKEQGHSTIFSILRSLKKSLTMDSVGDVLLDQFNECEGTRSLGYPFNFRES